MKCETCGDTLGENPVTGGYRPCGLCATRLRTEVSRSTERRLDVQRDAMSDFDRDKIGHEDNDGTLGLRDRRG